MQAELPEKLVMRFDAGTDCHALTVAQNPAKEAQKETTSWNIRQVFE